MSETWSMPQTMVMVPSNDTSTDAIPSPKAELRHTKTKQTIFGIAQLVHCLLPLHSVILPSIILL